MTIELDLVNRDPNDINDHLQVAFEDVLAEPDGAHSWDCVWKASYFCFNCCKGCCYKIMTLFCGICIACGWGIEFAMVAFNHIWCITPDLRLFMINCGACQKFWGTCVTCLIAPICEACGLCFSRIAVSNS